MEELLINRSKRVPNLKKRVDETIEQAVVAYAIEYPAHGQHRTSNGLRQGIFISGSGVRSIWLRHDLENFKKRLKALKAKVASEGIILNDKQIAALERKKHDDEASGEIETAHPGYLGCQDTFYVGNLKGVGRVYQQTFIDSYSKVVHCKLYTIKHLLLRLIYSTIKYYHFITTMTCLCLGYSLIEELSIVVR